MGWSYDSAFCKVKITGTQNLVSSFWTGIWNVLFNVDAVKKCRVLTHDWYLYLMSSAVIQVTHHSLDQVARAED